MAEFAAGIPVCNERFADSFYALAFEHAEFAGIAVLGFSADFCERGFASRREGIWIVDERRRRRRRAGCAAFCSSDELQGTGAVDCGDVDTLRGWFGDFFAIEIVLAVDGRAFGCGILRHGADGGDEYDFTESCARPTTRTDHGGLRDDVYGRAADWVADRGDRGEAYRGAAYIGPVWDVMFLGEFGFYFSRGDAFAAAAGGSGSGVVGWWFRAEMLLNPAQHAAPLQIRVRWDWGGRASWV